jgi:acetate kinase
MTNTVLCINAGSSSIKFNMFEAGQGRPETPVFKGQIEGIGVKPHLVAQDADGRSVVDLAFASADMLQAPPANLTSGFIMDNRT